MENLTPNSLLARLKSLADVKKILVAYSGGLDSHVLLHLLSKLPELDVRAMHIHHGLLKEADSWVTHCQRVCSDLDIPLQVEYLNLLVNKGDSLEDVARVARYKALKSVLNVDELLVTAHHQSDQTETLFLQLFRGAGVDGLASMPAITSLKSGGFHARPLLSQNRLSFERYAKDHHLNFIEDPSNTDMSFDRNYLRNRILPLLRDRWLGLDKTIGRSASIQAETKHLLEDFAGQDLNTVLSKDSGSIDLSKLSALSLARQKLVIRFWIKSCGFSSPSEKKLQHIFSDVIGAAPDAQPLLEWTHVQLRRYKNKLYIMEALSAHDSSQVIEWDIEEPLFIRSLNQTLVFSTLDIANHQGAFSVRFRQGGESIFIPKRGINISLKNLFVESNIPPWLRSRLPLIYRGNTLIKIIGLHKRPKIGGGVL